MPISTDTGRLAAMEWDQDWEPGLPLSPGAIGQDDQQQLLWGFPEILWEEAEEPDVGGPVCGTAALVARVAGTAAVAARVAGTAALESC